MCGDTHSSYDIKKLNTKNWPEQKSLCKEDLLVVLGDFGLVWDYPQSTFELWYLKWLSEKNCTVAFIDGNHENFDRLEQYPVTEKWGGKVREVYKNVYHLMRGEVYSFSDKKVLTIGGAESIDKKYRTIGVSWWKQETITQGDIDNAMSNLEKVNFRVDYVLTHTCPTSIQTKIPNNFMKLNQHSMNSLDYVENFVEYGEWHFGHFHMDLAINDKFRVHYNNKPWLLFKS